MTHLLTEGAHVPPPISRARSNIRYRLHVSNADSHASGDQETFAQLLRRVLDRDFGGSDTRGARADFARAAGINVGQIGRYLGENGRDPQTPRPETLRKMAPLLGLPWHKLQDLANAQQGTENQLGTDAHPYAIQVNQLLTEGQSDMPEDERKGLEQVLNTVLSPYRRRLRGRKAA